MNYRIDRNSNKINIKNTHIRRIFNKSKKKTGFTLIEIIAVIAIMGILATVILPNVSGYIKEAKKVKVVDQSKKVIMAVETYNLRSEISLKDGATVKEATSNRGVSKYLEGVKLDNLNINSTSLKNCYEIINGAEFDFLNDSDILNPSTITVVAKAGNVG